MDRRRPARTGADRRRPAQTGYFQCPRIERNWKWLYSRHDAPHLVHSNLFFGNCLVGFSGTFAYQIWAKFTRKIARAHVRECKVTHEHAIAHFSEFWKVTSRKKFLYCARAMMHQIWCMVSNFNTPYMVHRFWSETKRFRYILAIFRYKWPQKRTLR